ncbi:nuclease SbcCD subunit C [Spirochaetia bacterium]|nr:nuclease SbcCD subunit C [Spirochaetia bacterium]
MRINRLTFENINSLAGKWEIDFTDPAFNDGIFILAGPTGAGKTTILDAICLGLYGETSRQNSFSAQTNEVMTKGTSHCAAQVEFESQGKQYRSFWEHQRKKKSDTFQPRVTRKIFEITKNKERVIAETITDAEREITSVLKMDFKQFTSAVLLPQGKFDEFLNAKTKDRSEILEKITGAHIYSQIGSAVQERKSEEEGRLKAIKEDTNRIAVLTADEEAAAVKQTAEYKEKTAEQEQIMQDLNQRLLQCQRFEQLQKKIRASQEELDQWQKEKQEQAEDFNNLERAKKAADLFPLVNAYEQNEKESAVLTAEIAGTKQELALVEESEKTLVPRLNGAQAARDKAMDVYTTAEPLIQKIREQIIDLRIKQNSKAQKETSRAETEHEITEHTESFCAEEQKLKDLAVQIARLEKNILDVETQKAERSSENEDLQNQINELAVFSSALTFEESRKKLSNGEACPLCGSTDHPFCTDTDHFKKQQDQYQKLCGKKQETEKNLRQAGAELEALNREKTAAEQNCAVTAERQNAASAALKRLRITRDSLAAEAAELEKDLAEISAEMESYTAKLPVYGQTEHIDHYEREIQNALKKAEFDLSELQKNAEILKTRRALHEKTLADKQKQEKTLFQQTEENRAKMEAGFAAKGFAGHTDWRQYFWETGRIVEVERKKTELAIYITREKAALAAMEGELAALPAFPPNEAQKLEQELQVLRETVQQMNRNIGELNNKLAENETRKSQKAELEKDTAAQQKIYQNWKRMDEWIGGKDGYRFKQFAQAITFQQLIHNSRPYLLQMSGERYELLAKTGSDTLLPQVIDRHQGSIERVITNLSGGERFLLSLALALGLSKLNSKNLQIDSLFLDEGFGTLDKETLELAINILSSLQLNQGKLTGIISHVEELQERIGALIRVTKSGGGRSAVSGCGVRQL